MSVIEILRSEYPGDAAWARFVDVFRPAWRDWQDKNKYSKELGDEEIAMVLTASMGSSASDWFSQPCKALGGKVPIEVFSTEQHGKQIVRTLLMRMPR
jgi:hypothetical protein